VKRPSVFVKTMEITGDTELSDGPPTQPTTHISIDTRIVGSAELIISERPLSSTANVGAVVCRAGSNSE
jgi:hypothetical protein